MMIGLDWAIVGVKSLSSSAMSIAVFSDFLGTQSRLKYCSTGILSDDRKLVSKAKALLETISPSLKSAIHIG